MNQQWIIVYLLVTCTYLSHQLEPSYPLYRAAVLKYRSKYVPNNAELTLNKNCDEYISFIEVAQFMDVNIIVFPEYGLTSMNLLKINNIHNWTTDIPYPVDNYIPCVQRSEPVNNVLIKISCAARKNHIYVVINIAERIYSFKKEKTIYYNSNVVFDNRGTIIARYRKMHLSNEESRLFDFLSTEQDEAIFYTNFGVKFATFTSYDILFYTPALQLTRKTNITHIAHPTAWYSETPFLTATQIEAGWSFTENVNLLTSSYNNPDFANIGGGIYLGHKGIGELLSNTVSNLLTCDISKTNEDELKSFELSSFNYFYHEFLYGRIQQKIQLQNEDKNKLCIDQENINKNEAIFLYRDYSHSVPLRDNKFETDICHNDFCCHFKGQIEKEDPCIKYRFTVFKKHRPILDTDSGVLTCSIIQCSSNSDDSCGSVEKSNTLFKNLEITAVFKNYKNLLIMPSTLNSNLLPLNNWTYSKNINGDDISVTISLERKDNIVTFGLFSRNFSADHMI